MKSTGISSPLRGYGLRKFLISTSHLYHYEAIPSPALLMLVHDNIQLLKLKVLISLSSLPISKASIIPVFPGTLKIYLRYIHLFPSPSPLPRVQVVIISQLISTLPWSTFLSSFISPLVPAYPILGTLIFFSIPRICQIPTRATAHAVHSAWNIIPLTLHKLTSYFSDVTSNVIHLRETSINHSIWRTCSLRFTSISDS